MKYAFVQSGAHQYRCVEGDAIEIDSLPVEAGAEHVFDQVLLVSDPAEGRVAIGRPNVPGARVTATVVDHVKGPKLISFRYKAKERQRSKRGHRQMYTRIRIESIEG